MRCFFKYFLTIVFFAVFYINQAGAQNASYPDVKIISSDSKALVIEYSPLQFKLTEVRESQKAFKLPSFHEARYQSQPGAPQLPFRVLRIGIPQNAKPTLQILGKETDSYSGVNMLPAPHPVKDRQGLNNSTYQADRALYANNAFLPQEISELHQPSAFRDIKMVELKITPMQYNPAAGQLAVYKKIRLKINYNAQVVHKRPFEKRGKLDALYQDMFVNFEQAKNWQQDIPRSIAKTSYLPDGTWYKIPLSEDGLYKITPSKLSAAGIDVNNLAIEQIQMFNNGGHMLDYRTTSTHYNPPFLMEIPVFLKDVDQNGLFNGNDFIIFYGKHVNGWFYDYTAKDFIFHEHLYAKENVYWLTVKGNSGLRILKDPLHSQPQAANADFFYERYHFEEDLYNLLASGPDWYGRRFYGRSDSYSKSFTIIPDNVPEAQATYRIQFKGGMGVKWGDNDYYKYTFDVTLNNHKLFTDYFTKSSFMLKQGNISDLSWLINGNNKLSFQYTGNIEAAVAHLDWFEFYYPRYFTAQDKQLRFITKDFSEAVHYSIGNFGSVSDVYVFDVSDPLKPVILAENLQTTDGTVSFDLPRLSEAKEIMVSSLSSSAIKTVNKLTPVQRGQDLISSGNQADYLIITPQAFLPYAQQMAELRPELSTKVVTVDEVYFEFNSGVPDPTAIRNFIRHAYYNWQKGAPSYVLLFGDAHYDYRNIVLADSMRVPTWEVFNAKEIDSRATDNYFVDVNYSEDANFGSINPDLAIGRLPIESTIDAERFLEKIKTYETNPATDGWQTVLTFVADDNIKPLVDSEYQHQWQTEEIAQLSNLRKFIRKKIYISSYPSKPGGFGREMPEANKDLIDALNQGTLIVNYIGHGSPTKWAHENVFLLERDLDRINNEGKLPFLIAATCDFGKFDDPHDVSFTEALIWKEKSGVIAALATSRLVWSGLNYILNKSYMTHLFPGGGPSRTLGAAKLLSTGSGVNDQKFILFADPTMHLADPREQVVLTSISPDTLKALSEVTVQADIHVNNQFAAGFEGDAFLIVNDARYDSVTTAKGFSLVTLPGPLIFKGRVGVSGGRLSGKFIVPKSIRYKKKNTGRITLFAYDSQSGTTAMGYNNALLFTGSEAIASDGSGPEIDIYFEENENFSPGDLVTSNPVLLAEISDEHGVNITGQAGHKILLQIDEEEPRDVSGYFAYEKNSFRNGKIRYPMDQVKSGVHSLEITAFDNLNNLAKKDTEFRIASGDNMILDQVVNYPNPFKIYTTFTFQTNRGGADVLVKIYTMTGRLIQKLEGFSVSGFNEEIAWDGRDRDGDRIANGVYIYKVILRDGKEKKEVIEKLVIMR